MCQTMQCGLARQVYDRSTQVCLSLRSQEKCIFSIPYVYGFTVTNIPRKLYVSHSLYKHLTRLTRRALDHLKKKKKKLETTCVAVSLLSNLCSRILSPTFPVKCLLSTVVQATIRPTLTHDEDSLAATGQQWWWQTAHNLRNWYPLSLSSQLPRHADYNNGSVYHPEEIGQPSGDLMHDVCIVYCMIPPNKRL